MSAIVGFSAGIIVLSGGIEPGWVAGVSAVGCGSAVCLECIFVWKVCLSSSVVPGWGTPGSCQAGVLVLCVSTCSYSCVGWGYLRILTCLDVPLLVLGHETRLQ